MAAKMERTESHTLQRLAQILPGYRLGIVAPSATAVHENLGAIANRAATRSTWRTVEELLAGNDLDQWLRLPIPVETRLQDYEPRPFAESSRAPVMGSETALSGLPAASYLVTRA